jgi:hypothetical protein
MKTLAIVVATGRASARRGQNQRERDTDHAPSE